MKKIIPFVIAFFFCLIALYAFEDTKRYYRKQGFEQGRDTVPYSYLKEYNKWWKENPDSVKILEQKFYYELIRSCDSLRNLLDFERSLNYELKNPCDLKGCLSDKKTRDTYQWIIWVGAWHDKHRHVDSATWEKYWLPAKQ